jgi:ribonuclease-3
VTGWLKRFYKRDKPPINIEQIESVIGYHFTDPFLLYRSLKHRSYSQAVEGTIDLSNERLEFLGDSVFNMVISHTVFEENPDFQEGDLTKLKSTLVSKTSAETAARMAGIDRFILLSDSEEDAGGRNRVSIIADTYEAIIGAIFLDGGLEEARKFIQRTILDDTDVILGTVQENYKSRLLELTQAKRLGHPSYRTISENGPDHDKVFTVEAHVKGAPCGIGKGKTKKAAQQLAAQDCLEKLKELKK